jgi:hypothetical protein
MFKMPTDYQAKVMLIAIGIIGSWTLTIIIASAWLEGNFISALLFTSFFILTSLRMGVSGLRSDDIKWPVFIFAYLLPLIVVLLSGLLTTLIYLGGG